MIIFFYQSFKKKVDGYLTLDNNDVLTIVIKFKPRHIES